LKRNREVIRFGVEEGARPIRTGAALLDRNGGFLGHVTSCVTVGSAQVGLALAHRSGLEPETPIALLNPQKDGEKSKGVSDLRSVSVSVRGEIRPRFLSRDANDKAEGS
jgi:hypothetical protein